MKKAKSMIFLLIASFDKKNKHLLSCHMYLIPILNKFIIYLTICTAVDYFHHILPAILPYQDGQAFKHISLHSKYLPKVREKNFETFANLTILYIWLFWV